MKSTKKWVFLMWYQLSSLVCVIDCPFVELVDLMSDRVQECIYGKNRMPEPEG